MKSGENGLIGPGSNDYGRADKPEIQRELTLELTNKIWKSMQKKVYDEKVSKEAVLHHLKQLKASIGRMKGKTSKNYRINDLDSWFAGIYECNQLIDKLINKIKK